MTSQESGRRRRWIVGLTLAVFLLIWIAVYGRRLHGITQNVAWHVIHRNNLSLSQTVYTIPLDWRVERLSRPPSGAFLMAWARVPTMVSLGDGLHQAKAASFEDTVASARESFSNRYKLVLERRFRTGLEENLCFEGTHQELGYVAECWGSSGTESLFSGDQAWVGRYYDIIKSARRLNVNQH